MDKSSLSNRLQPQKPDHLSLGSKMIDSYSKNPPQPPTDFPRPLSNLKKKKMNNSKKLKLKDTDWDETCGIPPKKLACLMTLSPDQGCFEDFSSGLGRLDSSIAGSSCALLDMKSGNGNDVESPSDELCFDNNVDSMFSLSPLGSAVNKDEEEQVEGKDEGNFSESYLKRSTLESFKDEFTEGNCEEWCIGPPLLESTFDVEEQDTQDKAEVIKPAYEGRTTLEDTSYDASSLLQVQVKSVVVTKNKPIPQPQQRPQVFGGEVDWEREKSLYMHLVARHMDEKPAAGQDVMTELQNLMTHVADQTHSSGGHCWQHPADLTSRNYQRRFGNLVPKMSLQEWKAKNVKAHKRFATVPKIFERSPLP